MNKDFWIKQLRMEKHPEGGYYTPSFSSSKELEVGIVGNKGVRPLYTSIYFLIEAGDASNFHKLEADEIWYYHEGEALTVAMIHPDGTYSEAQLGLDFENGQRPQVLVPAGTIFGSFCNQGYSLVGCMVSYGFDFEDFKLYKRSELLNTYPEHKNIIKQLTRED